MIPFLKKINPFILILIWLAITVIGIIICTIILGISTPGGEQKPFIFIGKSIPVIVYGILFLGMFTIPFYWSWVKKYWYINLVFIIGSLVLIIIDSKLRDRNPYFVAIKKLDINGKEIEQIIEYYDSKFQKVRSISFYSNGEKDSTWTVFGRNGNIINQKKFFGSSKAR